MVKKKIPKKKENYIQVCPKCKSIDIQQDKSTLQQIGEFPTRYICNNCGHSGYNFPEVLETELEEFEKEIKVSKLRDTKKDKTPLLDDNPGKFEVRFLWKIWSPLLLVIGIIASLYSIGLGIGIVIIALFMGYITFFKKRKLRED